ncbi:hypothetical protein BKA80DRAFT_43334 [Phyllosticta citrichinensis]
MGPRSLVYKSTCSVPNRAVGKEVLHTPHTLPCAALLLQPLLRAPSAAMPRPAGTKAADSWPDFFASTTSHLLSLLALGDQTSRTAGRVSANVSRGMRRGNSLRTSVRHSRSCSRCSICVVYTWEWMLIWRREGVACINVRCLQCTRTCTSSRNRSSAYPRVCPSTCPSFDVTH